MSGACERMVMLHFDTVYLCPALWSGAFQLTVHRPSSKLKELKLDINILRLFRLMFRKQLHITELFVCDAQYAHLTIIRQKGLYTGNMSLGILR